MLFSKPLRTKKRLMNKFLPCFFLLAYHVNVLAQQSCRQFDYQQVLMQLHPSVGGQYQKIESFSLRHLPAFAGARADTVSAPATSAIPIVPEQITIPVIVHILWNNSAQNISNAQVFSQIAVLNQDFNAMNTDRSKIPAYFRELAADCGIRFELATMDPQGHATCGIIRKQTSRSVFGFDDKAKSGTMGGDDAWDADSYLNVWVCNLEPGISGYASAPGGPKEKDGVVINTAVFGTINVSGAFNKGRTAVHEIGHWLNLRHIWGDANCGDDKVDDTPAQSGANRGCNSGEKFSCGTTAHGDMYMNYMDFSDDACMYMFTKGQRQRMRVLFEAGGPRNTLLSSNGLSGAGLRPDSIPGIGKADFDLMLYPNPAGSSITLQLHENCNGIGKKIFIYNQLGQIVKIISCLEKLQQLDISSFSPGLYFIKIEGVAINTMKKFIKQ
jgi:hypothetical protein